jgi:hypothetical protein
VRAFFADFRELSEEFIAALPWSGAGASLRVAATEANAAARKILQLRVDLPNGSLVTRADIGYAVCCAAGDVTHGDGRYQEDRLAQFVARLVPAVGAREAGQVPGLEGAAWSREVDAVLNPRLVWSRRADLQFVWFGKEPHPRYLAE